MAGEDEVALGAGAGDVEKALFILQASALLGVVTGEFILGDSGDEYSAARLVKVTPKVLSGRIPSEITAANRSAMIRVLPVPAGASTSKVP